MSSALFIISYASTLLLPGIAVERLFFRDRTLCVLSWVALSYSLFVLMFIIANYLAISTHSFSICVFALLALSLLSIIIMKRQPIVRHANISKRESWLTPTVLIVALSSIYQLIFGVFTEVPADLYSHLERYQFAYGNLSGGDLGPTLSAKQLLLQGSGVFYYLIALSNSTVNLDTHSLLPLVDFTNRTLFLLSVFFFANAIFKEHAKRNLAAYLATAFTALHMGISVFAYTRYYSLAPTMLAMVLYFFSIAVFLRHIHSPFQIVKSLRNFSLICLAAVAAAATHTQEALFIGIALISISMIASITHIKLLGIADVRQHRQTVLISVAAIFFFVVFYRYSLENFPRAQNAHWRLWDFGEGPWFFPQLTILNLKFQFIRVVTLWGALVYLLFFLNIKRYRNNIFLLAGMLSPLITFLNPFFIDTFLRHYNSTTVWRLCYMLPIHFVAADLLIYYAHRLKQQNVLKKVFAIGVVFFLVTLLMPFKNTWLGVHYSRWPTLKSSETALSSSNYVDLINYLDRIDTKKTVLTDPMTGYMISALTKHQSPRRKFFRDYKYRHFSFEDYENNPLDKYSDYLLIINLRPKAESMVGALANHWRKNEWLATRDYYPRQLINHLQSRPERFKKIWEQSDITIYRITANR